MLNERCGEKVVKKNMKAVTLVGNACIYIDLQSQQLSALRSALAGCVSDLGVKSEMTDAGFHVSIAYVDGHVAADELSAIADEIAIGIENTIESSTEGADAAGARFGVLPGVTTPYDYIAIELEACTWMKEACRIAGRKLQTLQFDGGFKAHVSLLRIPKNGMTDSQKNTLMRELNASLFAAHALGRRPSWKGEGITVSSSTREVCYRKSLNSDFNSNRAQRGAA